MQIEVLDKGYVRLVKNSGNDLDVVNTARVSFDKTSSELSPQDIALINFLVKNKHDSCLRHSSMTFEVYAPLMVARQWWKHVVSSTALDEQEGWNESSRRYITENEQFYIPNDDQWRSAPENRKQGSGGLMAPAVGANFTDMLEDYVSRGEYLYEIAMQNGVAPEQARLFLPAYGMYVRWRWTGSLNAILNFLSLRLDNHAQWEIQQYAKAVNSFVLNQYPVTAQAWNQYRVQSAQA